VFKTFVSVAASWQVLYTCFEEVQQKLNTGRKAEQAQQEEETP